MIGEDIIDLREGINPGPRGQTGPQGERGLPGVNAVPADEAVAGYLSAGDSDSHASLVRVVRGLRPGPVVVFGDSWTQLVPNGDGSYTLERDGTLIRRLRAVTGRAVTNYGVAGHRVQDLGGQLDQAIADEAVDRGLVDDVVVVVGTNNVAHNQPFDNATVMPMLQRFRAAFPHARLHWFPDNSRTCNGYRTHMYRQLIQCFWAAGFAAWTDALWYPMAADFAYYLGVDSAGVQHLNAAGYEWLACYVACALAGQPPALTSVFTLPAFYDDDSQMSNAAGRFDLRFAIRGGVAHLSGYDPAAAVRDGIKPADARNLFVRFHMDPSGAGASACPVYPDASSNGAYLTASAANFPGFAAIADRSMDYRITMVRQDGGYGGKLPLHIGGQIPLI